jgi:hypothetical protein
MSYNIDSRNLATIRREIKEAIISKLEGAKADVLADVSSIVYGDRADVGDIDNMPVVWVLPAPHTPDLISGHTAIHDFLFNFIVMVYDMDNETGKDTAEDLSAKVYDVIVSDRSLGGKVYDVRPQSFDPSYEAVQNSSIYWASCEFAFRIQRRE